MAKKKQQLEIEDLFQALQEELTPSKAFQNSLLAKLKKRAVLLESKQKAEHPEKGFSLFNFFSRRAFSGVVAVIFVVSTGGLSTFAYASETVTAQSPLYRVKKALEIIEKTVFVDNDEDEISYHLKMMKRRLGEARHLSEQGKSDIDTVLDFTDSFDQGISVIETIPDEKRQRMYFDLFETAVSEEEAKLQNALLRRHQILLEKTQALNDDVSENEESFEEEIIQDQEEIFELPEPIDNLRPSPLVEPQRPIQIPIQKSKTFDNTLEEEALLNSHKVYLEEARELLEKRKAFSKSVQEEKRRLIEFGLDTEFLPTRPEPPPITPEPPPVPKLRDVIELKKNTEVSDEQRVIDVQNILKSQQRELELQRRGEQSTDLSTKTELAPQIDTQKILDVQRGELERELEQEKEEQHQVVELLNSTLTNEEFLLTLRRIYGTRVADDAYAKVRRAAGGTLSVRDMLEKTERILADQQTR